MQSIWEMEKCILDLASGNGVRPSRELVDFNVIQQYGRLRPGDRLGSHGLEESRRHEGSEEGALAT